MRVMHVVLSLDCGGLERVVLDLVRGGQALGQELGVLCLERPGTLAPLIDSNSVTLRCIHKKPGLSFRTSSRIKEVFREFNPTVVHTHQIGALFYAGSAARKLGVPAIIHTEHGKHYRSRFRTRVLGRVAARHASRFICVSKDIAKEVESCRIAPSRNIRVLPNGIDVKRFAPSGLRHLGRKELAIPEDAMVIGTIGRLNEVKRQDLLIQAFAQHARRDPDARLLIVGDGPLQDDLRQLAMSLGVQDSVCFTGYKPDPERFLELMDVFVLSSRSEGMPLSVLEAWAAGVPVVTSDAGGLPELIRDGETGLLFPSGDQESLAAKLQMLLSNGELAANLRVHGRARVAAEFSLDKMTSSYHEQYLEVLGQVAAIP